MARRDRRARFAARAFVAVAALIGGAGAALLGGAGCSGWDPAHPFEHESPDVNKAIAELDAGRLRSAEEILETYLGTGPCSDAGIAVPDSVKTKNGAGFDLGLLLFSLAEDFGQPFGDEEEGAAAPDQARLDRLRGMNIDCALLVVLAIAKDPSVPLELRARAHYLAGNLEFLRRKYLDAIAHYDDALQLVPGIVLEAGGDDIGRDAAWNRAIALRRLPWKEQRFDLVEAGADGQDGEDGDDGADGADGADTGDADGDIPDDAGDAGDGGPDADGGDAGNKPDGSRDGGAADAGDAGDASREEPADGGDAGDGGDDEPEPAPADEPPNAPDPKQDERLLDQLEQAPTYQEQEAKQRGAGRRRTTEDK